MRWGHKHLGDAYVPEAGGRAELWGVSQGAPATGAGPYRYAATT
jgi:hypothetical protein